MSTFMNAPINGNHPFASTLVASDDSENATPGSLADAVDMIDRLKRRIKQMQIKELEYLRSRGANSSHIELGSPSYSKMEDDWRDDAAIALEASINAQRSPDELPESEYKQMSACTCMEGLCGETPRDFEHYFKTPMVTLLMKRLPWLIVLLLIQSFNAVILEGFQELLDQNLILTFFFSTLAGTQGNAGNQPSVMLTRALASGHVKVQKVLMREGILSIFTSAILSLCLFFRVFIAYGTEKLDVAFVLAFALFFGCILSILLGCLFSIGLDRIRSCDPADGATPLLTTVSDMMGVSLLCGIAYIILGEDIQ